MAGIWITIVGLVMVGTGAAVPNDPGLMPLMNHSDNFPLYGAGAVPSHMVRKAAVPPYLHGLIKVLQESTPEGLATLLEQLFQGVESADCKGHTLEWILRMVDITGAFKDGWALQMIDSWGKLPEGVLTGHVNLYGDFHECVGISVTNITTSDLSTSFEGRYCTSYLLNYGTAMSVVGRLNEPPPTEVIGVQEAVSPEELVKIILTQKMSAITMLPSLGVCLPSTCSHMDVNNILVNIFKLSYALIEEQVPPTNLPWPVTAACYVDKKPAMDAAAISVIVLLSALLLVGVVSGIVDCYYQHKHSHDGGFNKGPQSVAFRYFMAFSMYTNTKKWLSTRKSSEDLGCLHGIRFLSTAWVVLAHTYVAFIGQPQWNMIDIKNIWKDWTVLAVINGTFSVDTFFVMSGMLATYSILKMLDRTKGKLNVPMFYVHRYIRLTPTYAILVGIGATLLNYTGNGPFWNSIEVAEKNCRNNWWINLLYINNLYRTDTMCNGESWYLANDMQFYILSPLIVYPIWRWNVMGLLLLCIYTVLSLIAPVLVVRYANGALPAMVITADMGEGMMEIYMRPWSRVQTFLVGIWLGWIVYKTRSTRVNLSPMVVASGWALSTGLALAVLFGIYPWFKPDNEIPEVAGYFYAGLSRFTWGVALSWVIFACVKGYGGVVNSFLSWGVFMPLGRLCFCVYLVSLHLQGIFQARIAQPLRYDAYTMVNLFFAHMVMSCLVGFVCTLLFESPFIVMHKLIFEGSSPKPAQSKDGGELPVVVDGKQWSVKK